MTTYVGGLRARLIRDSLYNMLHNALSDLGWFDANRDHIPINMIPKETSLDEEIPLNTLSISGDNSTLNDWELGSRMQENRWIYYVDFFAEDDAIGTHMIYDVRDVLAGKMSGIGRTAPMMTVYDFTLATPSALFDCEFDNIVVDRSRNPVKPFMKYWFSIQLAVLDFYSDEDD